METVRGSHDEPDPRDAAEFPSTTWGMVRAAGQRQTSESEQALERLCRAYWSPLYTYVRRQGYSPEDAQDLTQAFFARLLEKDYLKHADPAMGRFRTFLLCSLRRFLVSEWRKEAGQKRGGPRSTLSWDMQAAEQGYAAEVADQTTPETFYEQRWAGLLMERVLARLRDDYAAEGKGPLFERLKGSVGVGSGPASYAEIAAELGMSPGAIGVCVHRLRQRCRDLLREEVAQTVSDPAEVEEELRHLRAVFSA